MKQRLRRLMVLFFIAIAGAACDQLSSLTATKIKDIVDRPREYENKEITIHGTVTESASIVIAKYFVLQDNSGSIRVFTDRTLPKTGEKLSVSGYVQSVEIGRDRWVVLREK